MTMREDHKLIAENVEHWPEKAKRALWSYSDGAPIFLYSLGKDYSHEIDRSEWQQARRELGLEPSGISEEDEEAAIQEHYERLNRPKEEYGAYFKDVRHIDAIDVYRVVSLFDCEKHGHAISHAAKKLLLTGARTGGKDVETEVREAIDSLHRWLEMREEDSRAL